MGHKGNTEVLFDRDPWFQWQAKGVGLLPGTFGRRAPWPKEEGIYSAFSVA